MQNLSNSSELYLSLAQHQEVERLRTSPRVVHDRCLPTPRSRCVQPNQRARPHARHSLRVLPQPSHVLLHQQRAQHVQLLDAQRVGALLGLSLGEVVEETGGLEVVVGLPVELNCLRKKNI